MSADTITTHEIEARYLPGVLQEIADLIGLPATLALVRAYGGVRLWVPLNIDPDHPLVKLVGHAAAAKLVDIYGGQEHFDIPRALGATLAVRDKQIRAQRAEGATHRELALRHRLTERQIRNILGPEEDDRQIGMF